MKDDYKNAVADFDKVVAIEPHKAASYLDRAHALIFAKRYDLAIADFDQAIELDPNDANLWAGRCWARALLGKDLQRALDDCNRTEEIRPDNPWSHVDRGLVLLKLGRFVQDLADYDAALQKQPQNPEPLYGRGLAKLKSGDYSGGNADIAAAKALKNDIADVFTGYGLALDSVPGGQAEATTPSSQTNVTQQDYADCQQNADVARSVAACTRIAADQAHSAADRALAYRWRATDRIASGALDEAIGDLNEAIRLDPQNAAIYASRAIANFRRGDHKAAIADYRAAFAIDAVKIGGMVTANAELKDISNAAAAAP